MKSKSLRPWAIEVEAGQTYWWCRCGQSQSQPFCDGSHKGTGISPLKYEAPRSKIVWFCGCKQTQTEPLCDGTHKALKELPEILPEKETSTVSDKDTST